MPDEIAMAGQESVWPPAPATQPGASPDSVFEFRPHSVLLLVLLSVFTLSIYNYYWA